MRIDVPEGQHPIEYVWGDLVPGIGMAAANFSLSVYAHTTLGLREFEAARLRIAQINGCVFCLDWRTDRDGEKVEEGFADAVTEWRTTGAFDDRTRLAAEYAERYALDHHNLDEEFWARMTAHYSQVEIVELSMSIGSWLAFGRAQRRAGPRQRLCAAGRLKRPGAVRRRFRTAPGPDRRPHRSVAMIFSMFRSARAVIVTNGLTLVLPGISAPSITYRPV
ncbi:hypothetical protein SLAVM298S_03397 [Streptomyces lavendulae subsp. lavendulae]